MAEGVANRALKHTTDRLRAEGLMLVFADGTVLGCAGGDGLAVNGDGIVHEEFDADCGETG